MSFPWAATVLALSMLTGCASSPRPVPETAAGELPVIQAYGVKPDYETVSSAGHRISIAKAIKLIIPRSYQVQVVGVQSQTLSAETSWDDQQDWTQALKQAFSTEPNLVVDIATGSRLVLIRQLGTLSGPSTTFGPADKCRQAPAARCHFGVPALPRNTPGISTSLSPNVPSAVEYDVAPIRVFRTAEDRPRDAKMMPVTQKSQSDDSVVDPPKSAAEGGTASSTPRTSNSTAEPSPNWELRTDDNTLRTALARWCAQAGWQLLWELHVDYSLQSGAIVPGTFQEAVTLVVRNMGNADVPIRAIFYQGNKVLRIIAKGME
jgi:Toxin co-regulated pilus biosynthesis protein Q